MFTLTIQQSQGRHILHVGQTDIGCDGHFEDQALILAVFSHKGKACLDGLCRRMEAALDAFDADLPGNRLVQSEDGAQQFGTAGADQPADTEDFALVKGQTDPIFMRGATMSEPVDLQQDIRGGHAGNLGKHWIDEIASDHALDEVIARGFSDGSGKTVLPLRMTVTVWQCAKISSR